MSTDFVQLIWQLIDLQSRELIEEIDRENGESCYVTEVVQSHRDLVLFNYDFNS